MLTSDFTTGQLAGWGMIGAAALSAAWGFAGIALSVNGALSIAGFFGIAAALMYVSCLILLSDSGEPEVAERPTIWTLGVKVAGLILYTGAYVAAVYALWLSIALITNAWTGV